MDNRVRLDISEKRESLASAGNWTAISQLSIMSPGYQTGILSLLVSVSAYIEFSLGV